MYIDNLATDKDSNISPVIGVGAGKRLGVRRIFVSISPNLPEKFLCDVCLQIFSHRDHEDLFLVWPPTERGSCVFLQMLRAIFWSQTTLGAIFARIFWDFCPDFWQIKTFGGALSHLHPHLLHHCRELYFLNILQTVDPELRLGSESRGGFEKLKSHQFFQGIIWNDLNEQQSPALKTTFAVKYLDFLQNKIYSRKAQIITFFCLRHSEFLKNTCSYFVQKHALWTVFFLRCITTSQAFLKLFIMLSPCKTNSHWWSLFIVESKGNVDFLKQTFISQKRILRITSDFFTFSCRCSCT